MSSEDLRGRRSKLFEALSRVPPPVRPLQGIYGHKVCQACGEIGSFAGFNGAIGSHGRVNRARSCLISPGLFVAPRHGHGRSPRFRGHLFCEFCRSPVPWVPGDPLPELICHECREAGLATCQQLMVRERSRFHEIIEGEAWRWGPDGP